MLKRMTDKLGSHFHREPPMQVPSSPSSLASSSVFSHFDRRPSQTTTRTSMSEFSKLDHRNSVYYPERECYPLSYEGPRQKGTYRLEDFIIQRTLGTGSFGRVHLVRSRHNLRFYAIKVLNKARIVKMKQVEHTNNEHGILELVQHPFIVNIWGAFQDSANLYMVMDFVPGGELFSLLRRSNRFPDPVAKFYAAEVALALNYLHTHGIIYRDLKPENILLNHDGHIKITDFGFAKSCRYTYTLCGTPDYIAPEVLLQGRYGKGVDWYALGVLIFEMLYGLPPYHQPDNNTMILYERIGRGPLHIQWPAGFSEIAKDLIIHLMDVEPTKRYGNLLNGARDIFGHCWFAEVEWNKMAKREFTPPYMPQMTGEGDASAFERYPEDNASLTYGQASLDPFGYAFPGFEYRNPGAQ
ncbi:kinase-like domain-containing protein [Desarmillaria ectypa]|nr:kinase-like domain-containing protein [Desarmillaria ectypa]